MSNSAADRCVGELRTLLRDWAEHTDTALVTLTQDLLQHYGFWDDDDHDAAQARRARFNDGVDVDLRAYDGWSNEPQKRPLTGRERDILCRILRDALRVYTDHSQRPGLAGPFGEARISVDASEIDALQTMRFVLDPRHD